MLACRKLIFEGKDPLILVFWGSFCDGQASFLFYMWLYAHNFLMKVLSIVFDLSAKQNVVKKLYIIYYVLIKMMPTSQKFDYTDAYVSFTLVYTFSYS